MNLKKYLLAIFLLLFTVIPVLAYTNSFESFDNSLVQGIEYEYQEPTKILFTQIKGSYDSLPSSIDEYLDIIYYYSITRLKLGNIPFHYAVDESGNIYKTSEYDEIRIIPEPYIVVGYLSNNGQMSNKAKSAILQLTQDLSYKYGISEYENAKLTIKKTENSFSDIVLADSDEIFAQSVNENLAEWEPSEREHKEYVASVENVENEESVEIGENLAVKVTYKNAGDSIWTSNRDPIYLSVKDSEESIFAVNNVWDSFSKVTTINSDKIVLPGETVDFEFELEPKVVPGEYSESFELLKFDDEPFEGSEFGVNFTVVKGDGRVVRITSPEYGYVNIRECRRFSCKKVHVVNDGEVYPVVEYHDSCWYKIEYGENQEGWFYCPYAEEIE